MLVGIYHSWELWEMRPGPLRLYVHEDPVGLLGETIKKKLVPFFQVTGLKRLKNKGVEKST